METYIHSRLVKNVFIINEATPLAFAILNIPCDCVCVLDWLLQFIQKVCTMLEKRKRNHSGKTNQQLPRGSLIDITSSSAAPRLTDESQLVRTPAVTVMAKAFYPSADEVMQQREAV